MQEKTLEQRVHLIEERLTTIPDSAQIAEIVRDTMKEELLSAGKSTKMFLFTLAAVIGSLTVIGGGVSFLLSLFGFTHTSIK